VVTAKTSDCALTRAAEPASLAREPAIVSHYAHRSPTSHERRTGLPWDHSYHDGPPPWDAGGPRSAVVRLCDQGAFVGPVIDAGCGSGDSALEIAARGIEVIGVDVAPTAIRQAQEKAAGRGIAATFLVADAFQLHRLGRTFASVLDCGLFHTFDDDERPAYVESLAAVTTPGSVLHLLCFSDMVPGDEGPRRISRSELRASFRVGWDVVSIEADRIETQFDPGGVPAWLAKIKRA
jgi:SAM-dependent methyltransferase